MVRLLLLAALLENSRYQTGMLPERVTFA